MSSGKGWADMKYHNTEKNEETLGPLPPLSSIKVLQTGVICTDVHAHPVTCTIDVYTTAYSNFVPMYSYAQCHPLRGMFPNGF